MEWWSIGKMEFWASGLTILAEPAGREGEIEGRGEMMIYG
jgi:hypothetical protein